MMSYLTRGLALTVLIAGGAATIQTKRLETAMAERAVVDAQLFTCGGRLDAVLRDVESDNEIDNLDLPDFDIPPEWMLREIPTSP